MACVVSHKHKFMFIHIPKTAGGTILSEFGIWHKELGKKDGFFMTHLSFIQLKKKYPNEFDKYFKFCFVRNPYDRLLSAFLYKYRHWDKKINNKWTKYEFKISSSKIKKQDIKKRFRKFVLTNDLRNLHFRPQASFICDKENNILADYVAKYENLNEEVKYLAEKLNLPYKELPMIRKTDHGNYRDYYGEKMIEAVRKKQKRDFKIFGYSEKL